MHLSFLYKQYLPHILYFGEYRAERKKYVKYSSSW